MNDPSIHPPSPVFGGSGHGNFMPSSQFLDNSSRHPPHLPHPLTAIIHIPFRTFAALFYFLLFPVSNDAS